MIQLLQYHRGRATTNEVWVFGLCDTSQTPALGYMEIVQSRDALTLLPIIRDHVQPGKYKQSVLIGMKSLTVGTIIWSDMWAAYNRVAQLPGVSQHGSVNHSVEFVDRQTGVHTNHIESYWNRVKTKFKRMKGCHQTQLPSYLDEFMWRERHGKTADDAMTNILRDIALWYPV